MDSDDAPEPYKPPREVQAHETLEALQAQGYYRTSRKHRLATRLDRFDWQQVIEQRLRMNNRSHGTRSLAAQYRACISRDHITFPKEREAEYVTMEHSQWAEQGDIYRRIPGDPPAPPPFEVPIMGSCKLRHFDANPAELQDCFEECLRRCET